MLFTTAVLLLPTHAAYCSVLMLFTTAAFVVAEEGCRRALTTSLLQLVANTLYYCRRKCSGPRCSSKSFTHKGRSWRQRLLHTRKVPPYLERLLLIP